TSCVNFMYIFFFQAEDGIRDGHVTGVQTCALPILPVGLAGKSIRCTKCTRTFRTPGESVKAERGNQRAAVSIDSKEGWVKRAWRSEERRVGKECRSRRWAEHVKERSEK